MSGHPPGVKKNDEKVPDPRFSVGVAANGIYAGAGRARGRRAPRTSTAMEMEINFLSTCRPPVRGSPWTGIQPDLRQACPIR